MRAFERAIRRSGIPIAMSEGFNPHPKISVPLALSVGISGLNEVLELELSHTQPLKTMIENLNKQLPEDLHLLSAQIISPSEKGIASSVTYKTIFENPDILNSLKLKVETFLKQNSVLVNRSTNKREKTLDIRPFIEKIQANDGALFLKLKVLPEGMAKAEEILFALGIDKNNTLFEIIRTEVHLSSE